VSEFKNLILERRKALGLSQRELAKAVGTSQQQIQRIESGVQAVRLHLAAQIATALKSPLEELFPKLRQSKQRPTRKPKRQQAKPVSDEAFLGAGIDPDPSHWTVKLGLAGGKEFFFSVSSKEKERISSIIWAPPADFDFVVFNTLTHTVVINRTQINYCNFLFDFGVQPKRENSDFDVVVHFIGTEKPERFGVEPDQKAALEDDQGWSSQLQRLLIDLDGKSADDDDILYFDDEDGERVYLRSKRLLCLEVPLLCCEPDLWRAYMESEDDDERVQNERTPDVNIARETGANK